MLRLKRYVHWGQTMVYQESGVSRGRQLSNQQKFPKSLFGIEADLAIQTGKAQFIDNCFLDARQRTRCHQFRR